MRSGHPHRVDTAGPGRTDLVGVRALPALLAWGGVVSARAWRTLVLTMLASVALLSLSILAFCDGLRS